MPTSETDLAKCTGFYTPAPRRCGFPQGHSGECGPNYQDEGKVVHGKHLAMVEVASGMTLSDAGRAVWNALSDRDEFDSVWVRRIEPVREKR